MWEPACYQFYRNVITLLSLFAMDLCISEEITTQREIVQQGSSFLAAMISNLLPQTSVAVSSMAPVPMSPVSLSTPSITTVLQPVVSVHGPDSHAAWCFSVSVSRNASMHVN